MIVVAFRIQSVGCSSFLAVRTLIIGCRYCLAGRTLLLGCKYYMAAGFARPFWVAGSLWLVAHFPWVATMGWLPGSHSSLGVQLNFGCGFATCLWVAGIIWLRVRTHFRGCRAIMAAGSHLSLDCKSIMAFRTVLMGCSAFLAGGFAWT